MVTNQANTERLIALLGKLIIAGALLTVSGAIVIMIGSVFEAPGSFATYLHLILFGLTVMVMGKAMLDALDYKPRQLAWNAVHLGVTKFHSKATELMDWSFLAPDTLLFTSGKGEVSEIITVSPIKLTLPQPPPAPQTVDLGPGFIYVMRRADGIYKLGRAINPNQRLSEHQSAYKKEFKLIRWYAVSDMVAFERVALTMTKPYAYKKEAGRKELRKMTRQQLSNFLAEFEQLVRGDIKNYKQAAKELHLNGNGKV